MSKYINGRLCDGVITQLISYPLTESESTKQNKTQNNALNVKQ